MVTSKPCENCCAQGMVQSDDGGPVVVCRICNGSGEIALDSVMVTLSDEDLWTLNQALTLAATECEAAMKIARSHHEAEAFRKSAISYRTLAARLLSTE